MNRKLIKYSTLSIIILLLLQANWVNAQKNKTGKIPVIVITDLYHPFQDPGDNLDLIMGYALPEIDLKAIILDITDNFRKKTADHPTLWKDPRGPREAGIIPITQLNYLFNKQVPYALGPMSMMKDEKDLMYYLPIQQQEGVNLLLNTLRKSTKPVVILSFGSTRVLAVAYNREPALMRSKISKIHVSGGTASHHFRLGSDRGANAIPGGEWNVALDVFAFTRLMRSDLPLAIYPCAGVDGAFVKDNNTTYWQLPDVSFVKKMDVRLQRYLQYAFLKTLRYDFLRAMDYDDPKSVIAIDSFPKPFHIWETALWMNVSGRKLVYTSQGAYKIINANELTTTDRVVKEQLITCVLNVRDDGRFDFTPTGKPTNFSIYYRENPEVYEKALQEALPAFYASLTIDKNPPKK